MSDELRQVTASRLASILSAIGWREMAREGKSTVVVANTILWGLAEDEAGDAPCPKCGHKTDDHDAEQGWCGVCNTCDSQSR